MGTKTKIAGLMLLTAMMSTSPIMAWADNGDVKAAPGGDASFKEIYWQKSHEEHMMAMVLNLSEDQQKQLKDIKEKQRDAKKGVVEQLKANRVAFETEIAKATADMSKINDLQAQMKTIQSQMVDAHLNTLLEIKKLLTPEQFAGYMALEKEEDLKKEMGHDRFGPRDGFGKMHDGHEHWGDKSEKDGDAK